MAKLNFDPLRDWVIFKIPDAGKTESGIIIPEQVQSIGLKPIIKVLAVGPACEKVKAGDTVFIHPSSPPLPIELNGVMYGCVNEFQVIGIIPE